MKEGIIHLITMNKNSKIYIAGHKGMVGSAILRKLKKEGYTKFILKTSNELDLSNQSAVQSFFLNNKPDYVFLAAAKVGGIHANETYRADFLYENLMIQNNVIHNSYLTGVKKLLFLGSSCIYPKFAQQPIKEDSLLTGELETTNEPYAIAKIAGLKLCENYNRQYGCNFISIMPTNLYGPNDNYDLQNSHVLPALLRKFHEAIQNTSDTVIVWGTGTPKREFLHVDDLADACYFLMQNYTGSNPINIGTGKDVSIKEIAELIKEITGFKGKIIWDKTKPDGTPRKLLDVTRINELGWSHTLGLKEGINQVYLDKFIKNLYS